MYKAEKPEDLQRMNLLSELFDSFKRFNFSYLSLALCVIK